MTIEAVEHNLSLLARGSLPRDAHLMQPRLARRLRLIVELGVLFVAAPLLIRYAIFHHNIPLPLALQPVLLGFIVYMLWDKTFHLRREIASGFAWGTLLSILAVFAVIGGGISWYAYDQLNGRFLRLPLELPRLWVFIMVMYPLMSVIPQELLYRTFFFHRYGPLFGRARWLAIAVNGVLFGFAHIIFGNWVSILLTALLGCLLAWRYQYTRSFWAVWLEHSLYGCLVFSVGLGYYFFTGVSSLN